MPEIEKDRKRCTHCGREKPLAQFSANRKSLDGKTSWCKACVRVQVTLYQQTEAHLAWRREYLARPEVKAARAEADRRRRERRKAENAAYRKTPRAKVLHCRRRARARLLSAAGDRRARLEALIASYDREIERMDREAERGLAG